MKKVKGEKKEEGVKAARVVRRIASAVGILARLILRREPSSYPSPFPLSLSFPYILTMELSLFPPLYFRASIFPFSSQNTRSTSHLLFWLDFFPPKHISGYFSVLSHAPRLLVLFPSMMLLLLTFEGSFNLRIGSVGFFNNLWTPKFRIITRKNKITNYLLICN